ncbi:MAG: Imm17 family immunity protein [Fusobacterium sp.]|uniref:Imm17 family immunity protein n=1 Tax=Fusobacterium sp. TaxID=68766 RepID=UPI0026DD558F|nr:Imm17 family immunity protein [Fusobacterium sp.]MDO4690995.1 Imm17 family immunity protein [Fusobacterium sp.]
MLEYLRRYPEFILIAMGATFLAGAIFNWSAITDFNSSKRNPITKLTVYLFGMKGYRILMGVIGLVLLVIPITELLKK